MSFTLHMQRPDWKQRIWDYINGKAPPLVQTRKFIVPQDGARGKAA
jgi:hypothetical protein